MKLLKIFPKNFINLILGRSVLNIADSFYMVAITIALVDVYNIEASTLTSFALIGMIPSLVAFSYSYFFNKIKKYKILDSLFPNYAYYFSQSFNNCIS